MYHGRHAVPLRVGTEQSSFAQPQFRMLFGGQPA
jgi:hypothetical protein